MRAASSLILNGLPRVSTLPYASSLGAVVGLTRALTMSTLGSDPWSLRMRSSTWEPLSSPGSMRSRSTRSGLNSLKSCRPSSPDFATFTSYPSMVQRRDSMSARA